MKDENESVRFEHGQASTLKSEAESMLELVSLDKAQLARDKEREMTQLRAEIDRLKAELTEANGLQAEANTQCETATKKV